MDLLLLQRKYLIKYLSGGETTDRVREDQYCLRSWTQSDSLLQLEIGNSNINENWNQYFIIDINIEFQYEDSLAKILQNHFRQTQSDHAHNFQIPEHVILSLILD